MSDVLNSILAALGNAGFPDEAAQIIEAAKSLDEKAQDEGVETKTMEIDKVVAETIKGLDWKSLIAPIVEDVAAEAAKKTVESAVNSAISQLTSSIDEISKRVEAAQKTADASIERTESILNAAKTQQAIVSDTGHVEIEMNAQHRGAISNTAAKLDGASRAVSAFGTAVFSRGN
jgi:hypothetical protein